LPSVGTPLKLENAMNFCSNCAHPVVFRIPEGDSLPRHVCDACGRIHYENPRVVAGGIAEYEGRILLCKRAIEPRHGLWTLPAGFMELGESTADAARRETQEEACAELENAQLFSLIDVPHINQVHLFYRGSLTAGRHAAGPESLETGLFSEADVPWEALAFRSVSITLQAYFVDRARGAFGVHAQTLKPL
jgi:ADP-ribose pyrophosphatase YjhB (NUDIX family)